MLHIILLLLKIIGIVLLVVLGVLLSVLLIVLLVPIRYRVSIEHGDEFSLEGTVNWILHIIHARISMHGNKPHIRVRIFGKIIYDNLKEKKMKTRRNRPNRSMKRNKIQKNKVQKSKIQKKKARKNEIEIETQKNETQKNETQKNETQKNEIQKNEIQKNEIQKNETKRKDTIINMKHSANDIKVEKHDQNITSERKSSSSILIKDKQTKKTFIQKKLLKIRRLKEKIIAFFKGIKEKIIRFIKKITNLNNKIKLVHDFIKVEENIKAIKLSYSSLRKLLKHILPTYLKSTIIFGTGDPCSTGQALGGFGILYGLYGDNIQITPDFENKRFEGKHYVKGRIRLITMLFIVIKLIMDKRFKYLKSNMKTLKEAL